MKTQALTQFMLQTRMYLCSNCLEFHVNTRLEPIFQSTPNVTRANVLARPRPGQARNPILGRIRSGTNSGKGNDFRCATRPDVASSKPSGNEDLSRKLTQRTLPLPLAPVRQEWLLPHLPRLLKWFTENKVMLPTIG